MRGICAAVLVFEGLVIFFATLVALDLSDVSDSTLWWVGGSGAVALPAAGRAAALPLGVPRSARCCRWPWSRPASSYRRCSSSALVFAGLWFFALHLGRKVERIQAARAADQPGQ